MRRGSTLLKPPLCAIFVPDGNTVGKVRDPLGILSREGLEDVGEMDGCHRLGDF
jgi:hypothetical protein